VRLDVDALLRRIGLRERPAPDAAGLDRLHAAYVSRIPYEDLAIQLGETAPLDVGVAAARVLRGGRGGYCFELNGLLAALLEALGFSVERHEGVVGPRGSDEEVNHLALVVRASGAAWLADAGMGDGWLHPLPLEPGRHDQGPLHWTVEAEPRGGWWIAQHPWSSNRGVTIRGPVVGLEAFDPHHARLSGDPESSFVRTLVVQRPAPGPGGHAARPDALRPRPGRRHHATARRRGRSRAHAGAEFGIDAETLGPQRLERLWRQACEQHDAWLAGTARAPVASRAHGAP
jgi:N-hydroxyarylamine O-acetyltransferase